jgi:hypothetical protein
MLSVSVSIECPNRYRTLANSAVTLAGELLEHQVLVLRLGPELRRLDAGERPHGAAVRHVHVRSGSLIHQSEMRHGAFRSAFVRAVRYNATQPGTCTLTLCRPAVTMASMN